MRKGKDAHQLNARNLGLAGGITLALGMFLLGIFGMIGWGAETVDFASKSYLGYASTPMGVLIGGIWGFIDGFVCGWFFGTIYNLLQRGGRH